MTFGNYVLFNLLVAILVEGFAAEVRSFISNSVNNFSFGQEIIVNIWGQCTLLPNPRNTWAVEGSLGLKCLCRCSFWIAHFIHNMDDFHKSVGHAPCNLFLINFLFYLSIAFSMKPISDGVYCMLLSYAHKVQVYITSGAHFQQCACHCMPAWLEHDFHNVAHTPEVPK